MASESAWKEIVQYIPKAISHFTTNPIVNAYKYGSRLYESFNKGSDNSWEKWNEKYKKQFNEHKTAFRKIAPKVCSN